MSNIVKNIGKEEWVYSGYGRAFDATGSWSFGNDFARNVIIFGFDNSPLSHTDIRKSNLLILGEGPTYGINGSFSSPEKIFSISFSKARTNFCLSLIIVICLLMEKNAFKFRADNRNVNFPTQFRLGSITDGCHSIESREVYLGGNVYQLQCY